MAKYKRKKLVKKNRVYTVNLEKKKKSELKTEIEEIYKNSNIQIKVLPKSRKKI